MSIASILRNRTNLRLADGCGHEREPGASQLRRAPSLADGRWEIGNSSNSELPTPNSESETSGFQIINLAGRRINNGMGKFIAEKTVKLLIANERPVKNSKILILCWTFKEDVPDIRNTRVIDIYRGLQSYGVDVSCYDPQADSDEVRHEYGIDLVKANGVRSGYDAIVLAVKPKELVQQFDLPVLQKLGGERAPVLVDVKGFLAKAEERPSGESYWQL